MDFEKIIDRKKHDSVKWNRYAENVIPLWVADMDFESAQPIQNALRNFIETGIYGYATPPERLAEVIIQRFKDLYQWEVPREWIVWIPSVVSGFYVVSNMVNPLPYSIMTSTPVYHPFLSAAQANGRILQAVDLIKKDGKWTMDFDEMRRKADPSTQLYLLCNPHNPTGRVYTKSELEELIEFCKIHDLILCSDEIHCDILLDKSVKHIPIASISEEAAMRTVSLYSTAKAFNTPGLNAAYAIIPNPDLRDLFNKAKDQIVPYMAKLSGDVALAAYEECGDWLEACLDYLRINHDYLYEAINRIDGLKMDRVEGTYLAYIDYSELGIEQFAPLLEQFGVGVLEAKQFGGQNHIRLNMGTQLSVLKEAVSRIESAVNSLK